MSEEWTAIARKHWAEAGVAEKIELRLAPALDTLAALEAEGMAGRFDFAFIDAHKPEYDGYYEACLRLVRPGGLIAFDNMLQGGKVADRADRSAGVNRDSRPQREDRQGRTRRCGASSRSAMA